ncbi:MAG: hypothetical protein KatS3mg031_0807 [Chitinophagales bacterium]|nr:MAG: hypothetical protein KatS3mg031_0807 [Chitinophagales bacterium]
MANRKLTRKEKFARQRTAVEKRKEERVQFTTNKKQRLLIGLLLAAIAFALYANTLRHGFLLDDSNAIIENHFVKQGIRGIPDLLVTDYRAGYWTAKGTLYRPLSLVMFAIEWELFPNNPFPGHLINVLLYALTAFLLFSLLCRLLSGVALIIPALITLLFITHPIHTEVVANIKSRDEILSFLFALGALHMVLDYNRNAKPASLAAAAGLYFLSLMSKESSITLIAAVPVMVYFFSNVPVRKNLIISVCFASGAVVYLVLRKFILGEISDIPDVLLIDNFLVAAKSVSEKTATAFMILGKYLYMLFVPHPLSIDYAYNQIPIVRWTDYRPIISLLVYVILAGIVIRRMKKKELWVFGIAFYLITISLYSNLVITIGSGFGERFLYVPSLGFSIAVIGLLEKLFPVRGGEGNLALLIRQNVWMVGTIAVVAGIFSVLTIHRNRAWSDHYTIYATDVRHAPNSARLHYWFANEIMKEKAMKAPSEALKMQLLDSAIAEYNRALAIYPDYADAFGQRGLAYYRKGEYDKAIADYQSAIDRKVGQWKVYNNLGVIYGERGDLDRAMKYFRLALKIDTRFPDPYKNLGSAYFMKGDYDAAIEEFNKALKYVSVDRMLEAELYQSLALCYEKKGDTATQRKYLQMAERILKKP